MEDTMHTVIGQWGLPSEDDWWNVDNWIWPWRDATLLLLTLGEYKCWIPRALPFNTPAQLLFRDWIMPLLCYMCTQVNLGYDHNPASPYARSQWIGFPSLAQTLECLL